MTRAALALAAITLLAFGLRAFRLDWHSYRGDETFVIWFVAQDWPTLIAATARNEPHPPLYYVLAKLLRDGFGDTEFVFRFLPLWFGVLAVPAIGRLGWAIARDRDAVWVGGVAAFLVAINPFHIWNAQDARMYTQSVAFVAVATVALASWLAQPTSRARLAVYVGCALGAAWTHYAFLPILLAHNVIVAAVVFRRWRLGVPWAVGQAIVVAPIGGWLIANLALLRGYQGNGDSPAIGDALQRVAIGFVTGRSGSPEWAALAGWLGLALVIVGAGWLARRSPVVGVLAIGTVVASVGAQWIASTRGPVFTETYVLAASGPYLLLLAAGAVFLTRWLRLALIAPVGGIALAAALSLVNYWTVPAFAKGADWRSEAQTIMRDARPDDLIILNYPDPTFEYYYRGAAPVRLTPATTPIDPVALRDELAALARAHPRIWLVPVRAANWDKDGLVEAWLSENTDEIAAAAFHNVRLVLYQTPMGVLADLPSRPTPFADGVLLRGVRITPSDGDCGPSCEVTVQLVWEATATPSTDYKVFVHVLSERDSLVSQSDAVPADWRRPTSRWATGDVIVDTHRIAVTAPSGRYRLIVGMYRADGIRLPLLDGRETVEIGVVAVR